MWPKATVIKSAPRNPIIRPAKLAGIQSGAVQTTPQPQPLRETGRGAQKRSDHSTPTLRRAISSVVPTTKSEPVRPNAAIVTTVQAAGEILRRPSRNACTGAAAGAVTTQDKPL
jgi:hypothetical protein